MDMVIVWALSWWFGAGWKAQFLAFRERLGSTYDYFSIGLLLSTLFAPFRQISAGGVEGSLEVRWRAFVDRLMSRLIGAFVRVFLILAGVIWLVVQVALGGVWLVLWPAMPFMPVIGFIAMLSGWVPVWI